MPGLSEMSVSTNSMSQDLIKHWLAELTCYTPQQVDTAIAQIQQQQAQAAQHN